MKVLITGANGFIGRNLQLYLRERKDVEVICCTRDQQQAPLEALLEGVDFVFHLAGINRPQDPAEFTAGNVDFTRALCQAVATATGATGRRIPVLFASSSQAALENAYGKSKRAAEEAIIAAGHDPLVPVHVFRLPNVFGKWCRPNYNSVVATFCHNIARQLPIQVNDAQAPLTLVYIDDVIRRFVELMDGAAQQSDAAGFETVQPQYVTTVGELARQIEAFRDSRSSLVSERVGTGLLRALYATYVSYLPVEDFSYSVPQYADRRGVFVEMLKTPDCGQFSFFTAYPGVTRGGHYHHSKTEKFLVIKGQAVFRFRHMQTGATHELQTCGETPRIVETVPGWTHDITNSGSEELVVMLWANEIFDRARPDTYDCPV
ncbi:UDP-2-acetamido-2,6-beta-L-arabino-hexul-4-ose reductase [Herbaspirillum robiniae]|uniref:Capsular biosynthesis protein n=1 Tax=Herbaspirillum robiniae TaxID=2014887 RepID=A0A246WLR5_9BURK|nr:NAD-dependent epimerase/dehydratase family protein [Herbaspirillum robiniae]OWY27289.1 capsular biosynthesis protein [Herbaspirillum robiniae]